MAITHRTFVLLVFPLCCASIAVLITSLATNFWFKAETTYTITPEVNNVNYGLFSGTHLVNIPSLETSKIHNLYMTCLPDRGVCALSCLPTKEERQQQLEQLLDTGTATNDCAEINFKLNNETAQYHQYYRVETDTDPRATSPPPYPPQETYISFGLWVSTVVFISLSILMAAVGAVFAVVNTAGNPVEPILGILGLYIWNITAVIFITVTMIIWGVQFAITLVDNAVIYETITGQNSSIGLGKLGYSYWLLIVAACIHFVCIGMLHYRRYLIRTTPPAPTIHMEEDLGGTIFLY